MLSQQKNWSDEQNSIYSEVLRTAKSQGQHKLSCPSCSHMRKKNKSDKPLSVNIDGSKIIYFCHHCNAEGIINTELRALPMKKTTTKVQEKKMIKAEKVNHSERSEEWLNSRGISLETAKNAGCLATEINNKPVIAFTFPSNDGKEGYEAIKYRTANGSKEFWWKNNATKLWGVQLYDESKETIKDTIVITEGEMDCLSIKEAFKDYNIDVYSVPNGAPNKIKDSKIDPSEDGRFKYVWEDREKFESVERIILATDADTAGDVLADELSRRLNKAKCYRVDFKGNKDANDLLINTDVETVRKQVLEADPIPLHGLNNIEHYADEFQSLYDVGRPKGVSTGIQSVDDLFTLQTGYLNVVTGYPGDGKSAFIDQLIVNAGKSFGWKTCYCSFEKPVSLHAVQLSQILTGKPFFEGANHRMNQKEKDYSESWINEHILFQDYSDSFIPTIEAILDKNASAVMRYGVRIIVIDPFNFIHSDYKGLESDMVSDMLTKVQLFCKQHDVLCFFVAHPTKPAERGKKSVVTGVDIAKSMAWFSKADLGLTVYRGESNVEVHCWKARWGWQAQVGSTSLTFNPLNGRYEEAEEVQDDFDWEF